MVRGVWLALLLTACGGRVGEIELTLITDGDVADAQLAQVRTLHAFGSGGWHRPQRALQSHAGREQPLDHEVVQVARDAIAVAEHRELLAILRSCAET